MIQSGLEVPRTGGRSRFSKALPAVPPIDTSPVMPTFPTSTNASFSLISPPVSAPTLSTSKALPDLRKLQSLPPPPTPPHNDDPRVPIQFTPLPPLPTKRSSPVSAAPTTTKAQSPPPKMTIARKPVGGKQMSQQALAKPQAVEKPKLPSASDNKLDARKEQPLPQVPPKDQEKEHNRNDTKELPSMQIGSQSEKAAISSSLPTPTPALAPQLESAPTPVAESVQVGAPVAKQEAAQPQTLSQQHLLPPLPSKSDLRLQVATQQQTESSDPQYQHLLKSPSESLSSIFSAYSRSDTASVVRSSDGTAYSSVEYQPKASVSTPAFTEPKAEASGLQQKQSLTRKPVANGKAEAAQLPPPPPSKDCSVSPPRTLRVNTALSPPSSPPREEIWPPQQIWRRRSLKGSRELPDLRLDHSHGSTASSSTASTITAVQKPLPPAKSPTPPPVPEKPSSSIDEAPESEAPPELPAKDNPTMGNGGSKIKLERLKNKFHAHRGSDDTTSTKSSSQKSQAAPLLNRPPTPEYQKGDGKESAVNNFISTVSPVSSPEPARRTSRDTSDDPNSRQKTVTRKALPAAGSDPTFQQVKSLPDLNQKVAQTSNEPLPSTSVYPPSGRNSPAFDPPRGRQPGLPGAYPPSSRNTSARPSSRGSVRPSAGPRYPHPESDPHFVRSPAGEFMYKGRDGTLYADMKERPDPDPRATHFPQQSSELSPLGAVFKAPTLKPSHHHCYQHHKTMLRRPNRRYPLSCQTCQKQDTDDRFSCNFCNLRICEPCLKVLDGKQRHLQALVDELAHDGSMSLSSPTRRGSALGLKINF